MLIVPLAGLAPTGELVFEQLDLFSTAAAATAEAASGGTVDPFVFRLSIFVLAVFVGYYVVGALLAVGVALVADDSGPIWARSLGFIALIFASINIFGGFLVTQRMLAM